MSNLFSPEKKVEEHVELSIEEEERGEVHQGDESALIVNVNEIEQKYENQLQKMLNHIEGVSDVEVMVNLNSTNVNVYEKNRSIGKQTTEETDKSGGERSVVVETEDSEIIFVRQCDREVNI